MRFLIYLLTLFLATAQTYGSELPAKAEVECDDDKNCNLKLHLKEGWHIYAHDDDNPESLDIELNIEQSKNVDSIQVDWSQQEKVQEEVFGIEVEYYIPSSNIPFKINTRDEKYDLALDLSYSACLDYCAVFSETVSYTNKQSRVPVDYTLFYMLLIAFLGGFILNLMPCVLPIVMLKVVHVSKKVQNGKIKEIIATLAGIITSFLALGGFTVLMKELGHGVGWGIHFQEPTFVALIAIITGLSALNMLGIFTLRLPGLMQKADGSTTRSSDFMQGVLMVALSTPCTAPFLGSAVAFCLSKDILTIMLVYLSIGIGLGLPYIVMLIYTKALKLLPKPGEWMNKLKTISAGPFAITSLWMLYVLYHQTSTIYPLIFTSLVIITPVIMKNMRLYIPIAAICLTGIVILDDLVLKSIKDLDDFKFEKISEEIKEGRTVVVNITADWCLTCKVNEKMVFKSSDVIRKLHEKDIIMMVADYTNPSESITKYISSKKRSGIPLSVVYGPSAPKGIVLPVLLSKNDLFNAIDRAK